MKRIKLIVVNEHTLGYVFPETPNFYSILHSSILKGAIFELNPSCKLMNKNDKIRLATEKDFDDFRVSSIGFTDNPKEYEYEK